LHEKCQESAGDNAGETQVYQNGVKILEDGIPSQRGKSALHDLKAEKQEAETEKHLSQKGEPSTSGEKPQEYTKKNGRKRQECYIEGKELNRYGCADPGSNQHRQCLVKREKAGVHEAYDEYGCSAAGLEKY